MVSVRYRSIFLFHEPPEASEFQLKIPALGEEASLPDSVLLNLPDDKLSATSRARKGALLERSPLPPELVKRFAPYGLVGLEQVSQQIEVLLREGNESILWRGYARYEELLAVFWLAWPRLKFNKKRLSAKAAAFYANRLRFHQLLRAYFDSLVADLGELEGGPLSREDLVL
jgi:hypothetical protein